LRVARRRGARRAPKQAEKDSFDEEWEKLDAEFKAQAAEMDRTGKKLTGGLFILFLGIAALMLVVAVWTGISTARHIAAEQPALGQVTELTERKDEQGNAFYYPVVAFDTADGRRQKVQLAEGSWPPAHRVGDLVTVLYQPADPTDARIDAGGGTAAMWTWTIVTGALAVAFALAAGLAWALR
jgi:hypothetical protein